MTDRQGERGEVLSILGTSLALLASVVAALFVVLVAGLTRYSDPDAGLILTMSIAAVAVGVAPAAAVVITQAARIRARHREGGEAPSSHLVVGIAFLLIGALLLVPAVVTASRDLADAIALRSHQASLDLDEVAVEAQEQLEATAAALDAAEWTLYRDATTCNLTTPSGGAPPDGKKVTVTLEFAPGALSFDELATRFIDQWDGDIDSSWRASAAGERLVDPFVEVALFQGEGDQYFLSYESACADPGD